MDKLVELLKKTEKIDELLEEIDRVARDEGAYEYGLPLYGDAQKALLREIVLKWIAKAID